MVHKVAQFTGLPEDVIERQNLRIGLGTFNRELLRDRREIVGRYDSRYTGRDLESGQGRGGYDPSYTAVQGAFTAMFNEYIKKDLHYENKEEYEILTGKVQPWNFGSARNRYLNVTGELREALIKNPQLHLFVASGYYDLATPFTASRYTFDHLNIGAKLHKNVTMGYYDAGHMMYLHRPAREKLKSDLAEFVRKSLAS